MDIGDGCGYSRRKPGTACDFASQIFRLVILIKLIIFCNSADFELYFENYRKHKIDFRN